ncbi:protein takeout-like [Athalia rosae]|uniref:protein takeout-like n=1 Tax=Athalia rosae TaxID=37344 RepID=UPI002033EDB5|nr:protein takeout-like [Athalia rosae]
MKTGITVFFTLFAVAMAANLPEYFKTCRRSDPQYSKCLDTTVTTIIRMLATGLKSFKIPPIEPLAVSSVKIGESNSPVALKQEYHNIKLHGLTNLEVKDYRIDWDKLILRSTSFNPQVDFVADYSVDGQVLFLPITGKGRSNITMYNLESTNTIYCETYEKDKETYMRVKDYQIQFKPERVNLHFENLFNGDNLLGEQMNRFINENSDLLFKELQSSYEQTFGIVFAQIANNIFSRVPMRRLFPQ